MRRAGRVFNDFALLNMDNHFRSVQITGSLSVAACRDRFFQSYCERIITSQPVLDQYLAGAVFCARLLEQPLSFIFVLNKARNCGPCLLSC